MAQRMRRVNVFLKAHAIDRWHEYVGPRDAPRVIANQVNKHLYEALKGGLYVDKTGAGHVQMRPDVWAVVVPAVGNWTVITFHKGENWPGFEEQRHKILGKFT